MINTPIDFGEMIGAPLNAIIQGETIAAQASADFIQTVGFVPDGLADSFGSLRMISFEFERKSESNPNGTETAIMRVPLLSLIPIPLLQVKNATIEFGLNITDFVSSQASSQTSSGGAQSRIASKGFSFVGAAKPRVKVLPQPIPTKSTTTQNTTTNVDLQMKLNIVQADIPSGLAKLFSAFEAAMGEVKPVVTVVETPAEVPPNPPENPSTLTDLSVTTPTKKK